MVPARLVVLVHSVSNNQRLVLALVCLGRPLNSLRSSLAHLVLSVCFSLASDCSAKANVRTQVALNRSPRSLAPSHLPQLQALARLVHNRNNLSSSKAHNLVVACSVAAAVCSDNRNSNNRNSSRLRLVDVSAIYNIMHIVCSYFNVS